nr:3-methyladenine DNA glycosylase [Serinibacter salmoneus]
MDRATWSALARDHAQAARDLTAAHRERRATGEKHAVEDFLFTYYPLRPAALERWSPGAGVALADAAGSAFEGARYFAMTPDGAAHLDTSAFLAQRGAAVRFHAELLRAVAGRAPRFDCFGLHEWAMVYREPAGGHRHDLPLRLGEAATDEVVETHKIVCTHIDAYRFFTPPAEPLNAYRPTRETQVAMDQGGCLHVGMDLMKPVIHLGPAIPGALALQAFVLARDIRELDMRASPYDVSRFGLSPVAIETPEGKAAYVAAQRDLSRRAEPIRAALLAVCEDLLDTCSPGEDPRDERPAHLLAAARS